MRLVRGLIVFLGILTVATVGLVFVSVAAAVALPVGVVLMPVLMLLVWAALRGSGPRGGR